jgi:hypothetical protein
MVNPKSGHTAAQNTLGADGLRDGDIVSSASLTNLLEGVHGNGLLRLQDGAFGESARNNTNTGDQPGSLTEDSDSWKVKVFGGYCVIDGQLYEYAQGPGNYVLVELGSGSYGSGTALAAAGEQSLYVIYISSEGGNARVNYLGGSPVDVNTTGRYPTLPTQHLIDPNTGGSIINDQTVVLGVLRCQYTAAGTGNNHNLDIVEINDKRHFLPNNPHYFVPLTKGALANDSNSKKTQLSRAASEAIQSPEELAAIFTSPENADLGTAAYGATDLIEVNALWASHSDYDTATSDGTKGGAAPGSSAAGYGFGPARGEDRGGGTTTTSLFYAGKTNQKGHVVSSRLWTKGVDAFNGTLGNGVTWIIAPWGDSIFVLVPGAGVTITLNPLKDGSNYPFPEGHVIHVFNNAGDGSIVFDSTELNLTVSKNVSRAFVFDGDAWVEYFNSAPTGSVAGSNTQVQYNSGGVHAASSNLTFDGNDLHIGTGLTAGIADAARQGAIHVGNTGGEPQLVVEDTNCDADEKQVAVQNVGAGGGDPTFGIYPQADAGTVSTGNAFLTFTRTGLVPQAGVTQSNVSFKIKGTGTETAHFDTANRRLGLVDATAPESALHISDTVTAKPIVILENTNNDATDAEFHFVKDPTGGHANLADADDIGTIRFKSESEDNATMIDYVTIEAEIADATNASNAGRLKMSGYAANAAVEFMRFEGTSALPANLIVNNGSVNMDFIVKDSGSLSALHVDGSGTSVGIGIAAGSNPDAPLHVKTATSGVAGNSDPTLLVESTYTGTHDAPELHLRSAAATAGYDMGVLRFQGKDAGAALTDYAVVSSNLVAATAGSEQGSLYAKIATSPSGALTSGVILTEGDTVTGRVNVSISEAQNSAIPITTVTAASLAVTAAHLGRIIYCTRTASNTVITVDGSYTPAIGDQFVLAKGFLNATAARLISFTPQGAANLNGSTGAVTVHAAAAASDYNMVTLIYTASNQWVGVGL